MQNLAQKLLISTPNLDDPLFSNSVVYIHSHNIKGTYGFIINKTLPTTLSKLMKVIEKPTHHKKNQRIPIFQGGPVKRHAGVVLHLNCALHEASEAHLPIRVSHSLRLLQAIADNTGPTHFMILLGSSHWSHGQLEQEIIHNDWIVAPCAPHIIFQTQAKQRRQATSQLLGISSNQITGAKGHA